MVRRCCVPKCTSASSMPVHRFPKNKEKAEAWLKAIDRNDLIGKKQNELRICTEHFTEEMFIKDRSRRCLKEDAHPISNINLFNTNINDDNIITDIHFSNTTENSTNNVILVAGSHQDVAPGNGARGPSSRNTCVPTRGQ
ncbi:hypothetical protein PUN28_018440 [Cardiocondyla obscurior]|uniref:THAP-type domain-containing protein n=1 Tax=Cardiocondyla obscurior TaxID=286306 RepID=A0AAW2EJ98_9HYME